MATRFLRTFASGFLMGSADVVPGVSGGTMALVLGIYERLVANIRLVSSAIGSLLKGDTTRLRQHLVSVEWGFLLTLLFGIASAVLALAHFIEVQLEERPVILAAAFFGLVLGSVLVASGLFKGRKPGHGVIVGIVGLLLFLALGAGSDVLVSDPSLIVYFGAGALAICAMILPGISGSLILVLVGMYDTVLGAVNDRDVVSVLVFVLGAATGLALFSQVLDWALRKAHDVVLAGLIGLMAGSLRILWPWPGGVASADLGAPSGQVGQAVLAAVVGLGFVVVVARLARPTDF